MTPLRPALLAVGLALGGAPSGPGALAAPAPVRYEARPGAEPFQARLVAVVNGKTVVLADTAAPVRGGLDVDGFALIDVVAQRDFDGDGVTDALVALSTGGNCCPPSYVFVSLRPGRGPRASASFESWAEPTVVTLAGRPVVTYRDEDEARVKWWGFRNGRLELVQTRAIPSLEADPELRIATFDPKRPERRVDLDGDGRPDTLSCEVWDRWNTLLCEATAATGAPLLKSGLGCDRWGVLPTRTRGHRDLVCGLDTVVRWNGRTYDTDAAAPAR